MPAREHVKKKIQLGYELTAEQEAFVMKATNDQGEMSRRKWQGLEEYPNSAIDNLSQ